MPEEIHNFRALPNLVESLRDGRLGEKCLQDTLPGKFMKK